MKEIQSHTNEFIKKLKTLKNKKGRDEHGLYIIEGKRVILEAMEYSKDVACIITCDKTSTLLTSAKEKNIEIISVPYSIIQQIADTKAPPREIACVKTVLRDEAIDGDFFVALDDVNDPKNLGSIIRTADAAGCDGVLISKNSADYFGPKAQRSAMGSHFHIPVVVCDLQKKLKEFKKSGGVVVATDLHGKDQLKEKYSKVCVIIGNEARGISENLLNEADVLYKLKMYGKAESLNAGVAAGIILYDLARNR